MAGDGIIIIIERPSPCREEVGVDGSTTTPDFDTEDHFPINRTVKSVSFKA